MHTSSLPPSCNFRVCLFEDRAAADLEPLSLTRPVFELLCGQTSLGEKHRRLLDPLPAGVLVRPHLADICRKLHPSRPVNDLTWLRSAPAVLVNGRWLPDTNAAVDLSLPHVALVDNEVAYAVLNVEQLTYCSLNTLDDCLATWKQALPRRPASGTMIRRPWELVDHNAAQLLVDFRQLYEGRPRPVHPPVLAVVGPREQLYIDPSAQVEPMVVADTTRGPVVIDRDAVVTAFSRLEGPCYVGPGSHVLGAKLRGGTTLGPHCRIGGEVEASIVHGFTNKYHEGFLGHSYLGEWVNFGAGTHNSDLRNDYGEVTVVIAGRSVGTGRSKVGCFVGDHTKTGLGTLLNTGTTVGIFCNLLPSGGLLPKYVPSFCSWWNSRLMDHADLHGLLRTAAIVTDRRGQALGEAHELLYQHLYDVTAAERRTALRYADQRHLRRSA